MVRMPCFYCRGTGSILGWGTKILQATQENEKVNEKNEMINLE